jgi:outer membrane protein assembly factor BamB
MAAVLSLAALVTANPCFVSPGLTQQATSAPTTTLVGPICPDQGSVVVAHSTAGATLVLRINDQESARRSGASGEVSFEIPGQTHLARGDVVEVAEQLGGSTTLSNKIVIGCSDVVTYHNDSQRTGWNANENTLTAANVNSNSFGLVAQVGPEVLDDQIDAQPLVVTKQSVQGFGVRNVVYVVTAANTVYALDAWSGQKLLSTKLGNPVPKPLGCDNNSEVVGITSTPTIDRQTQTLYVISYSLEGSQPTYKLHALDLSSLNERPGSPQVVAATQKLSDQSDFKFNATFQRQRAALLQANGNIYAGFASFCDFKASNSRGWVLGWNAATLAGLASSELTNRRTDSTTADCWPFHNQPCYLSSVWMSGYGLAADRDGNIFFATGNTGAGTADHTLNIAESVVKLSGDLAVLDLFTPNNAKVLDANDTDFGSGGVMVVPDMSSGSLPHMAVGAGKDGRLFILNRDNLGGFHTPDVPKNVAIDHCLCGPSYFEGADGRPRIASSGGHTLRTWTIDTAQSPALGSEAAGVINETGQAQGFFSSVSSDRKQPGTAIIWAVGRPVKDDPSMPLILHAFNAVAAGTSLPLLWSGPAGHWHSKGNSSNVVPSVANGMVYVASYRQLSIFGLKRPQPQPVLASVQIEQAKLATARPGGGSYWGTVSKIEGGRLSLLLRTGRVLDVDIGPAVKAGQAQVVTQGQPARVGGVMNGNGTFEANHLWRAPGQSLWDEDRAQ